MAPGDKVHYWVTIKGSSPRRSYVRNGTIRRVSACGKFATVEVFRHSLVQVDSVQTKRLKEGWK